MATLKDLRLEARISQRQLAILAELDHATIKRAEAGIPVYDATAARICYALSLKLGRPISLSDVEDLRIINK